MIEYAMTAVIAVLLIVGLLVFFFGKPRGRIVSITCAGCGYPFEPEQGVTIDFQGRHFCTQKCLMEREARDASESTERRLD